MGGWLEGCIKKIGRMGGAGVEGPRG